MAIDPAISSESPQVLEGLHRSETGRSCDEVCSAPGVGGDAVSNQFGIQSELGRVEEKDRRMIEAAACAATFSGASGGAGGRGAGRGSSAGTRVIFHLPTELSSAAPTARQASLGRRKRALGKADVGKRRYAYPGVEGHLTPRATGAIRTAGDAHGEGAEKALRTTMQSA